MQLSKDIAVPNASNLYASETLKKDAATIKSIKEKKLFQLISRVISVAKAEEEASKLYALNATTYKRSQAVVSSSENGRVIAKKTRPDETQEVSQEDIAEVQERICANLKNNPQLLVEVFGKDSNTLKREIEEESESNQFAAEVLGLNPTNLRRKDDRVMFQVISKVHEIIFME